MRCCIAVCRRWRSARPAPRIPTAPRRRRRSCPCPPGKWRSLSPLGRRRLPFARVLCLIGQRVRGKS
jgi:hypothetical protein